MRGILADNNADAEVAKLLLVLKTDWHEEWASLGYQFETFARLGLRLDAPDNEIWAVCQANELVLLTNNRNHDGPDSLEEAIRTLNTPTSLPVFTFANGIRFRSDPIYADRLVEHFLEYVLDITNYLGTGRLFLPRSAE